MEESKYQNTIRQKVIERLCIPLLEHVSSITLVNFFKTNIKFFVETLDMKFNKFLEEAFERQLINKICVFKMVAMMYQKLDKDDLVSNTSEILLAYISNPVTGKELTTALSK